VILEKDHNCLSTEERQKRRQEICEQSGDPEYLDVEESKVGYPRAGANKFASCIRIVDPYRLETLYL
jgi:hypothetical protein